MDFYIFGKLKDSIDITEKKNFIIHRKYEMEKENCKK